MPTPNISVAWFLKVVLPGFLIATGLWLYLSLFWGYAPPGADTASLAMYAFAGTLIGSMIDAYDPLLHLKLKLKLKWPRLREKEFFYSLLPSGYLQSRCKSCGKDCGYKASAEMTTEHCTSAWFYVFDNLFPNYLRGYALDLTSACRAVMYTKYVALSLLVLGTGTMFLQWLLAGLPGGFPEMSPRAWFIIVSGAVFGAVWWLHKPGPMPTGVWRRWRNAYRDQVFWLHINGEAVTKILCKQQEPEAKDGNRGAERARAQPVV